jgi:hypothetical protein
VIISAGNAAFAADRPTISGNHKPGSRNVDGAGRRRFNIAPFMDKPATPASCCLKR